MTASSRGSRAAYALTKLSQHPRVCSLCLRTIIRISPPRRHYAAAATVAVKSPVIPTIPNSQVSVQKPASSSGKSKQEYIVKAGVVLSRAPLLTKEPNTFESAFFFYQKRLNERLVMPFSRYFYFKKDTPADTDWKIKAKERNYQPARELGGYNAYSDMGWNDELLAGDKLSEPSTTVEALVRDSHPRAVEGKDGKPMVVEGAEVSLHEDSMIEMPLPRTTEADEKKDLKSLERKLDETLYLCVERNDENGAHWFFPAGPLEGRENLHQAAERVLVQTAGVNMNTWIVGHAPIGHHEKRPKFPAVPAHTKDTPAALTKAKAEPSKSSQASKLRREARERDEAARTAGIAPEILGERTFYMKVRIMAGQANLEGNAFGLENFCWLTKTEIGEKFRPQDFAKVQDMLADR
ncbi:putative 54S ribosomal protein L17, mitochondrial [Calycina marina]|uniref:Large ribosomal subunit protein mL46 n=1 Tax=Calycina marina TaxID=1763456 RepID=A0A9P7Z8K0_9HELO|nr:putative 54S ribosomal protein L17, mitochondrial [Calycina marina]